jgi:hypothetical protein
MTSLSRIVSAGIRMYATSMFRINHQGMAIKGQQANLECCGRVICGFWAPLSPSFICKAYSFLKTKKKPSPLFTTSPGGSGWCLGLGRQRQRALYEGLPHFQSFPAALGVRWSSADDRRRKALGLVVSFPICAFVKVNAHSLFLFCAWNR